MRRQKSQDPQLCLSCLLGLECSSLYQHCSLSCQLQLLIKWPLLTKVRNSLPQPRNSHHPPKYLWLLTFYITYSFIGSLFLTVSLFWRKAPWPGMFFLICSLLCLKSLGQWLASSGRPINICSINERLFLLGGSRWFSFSAFHFGGFAIYSPWTSANIISTKKWLDVRYDLQ